MRVGKKLCQLVWIAVSIPAFLITIAVKHGDEVQDIAVPQRIVNEMMLCATPEHDRRRAPFRRYLIDRQYGAIGDMARHARRTVLQPLRANARPQPIGANQRRAFMRFTILSCDADAFAVIVEARDLLLRT